MSIQKLGYKKNSPYKNRKSIRIDSNHITMDGVDQPLILIPEVGKPVIAKANSGDYVFPEARSVTEVPLSKLGSFLKKYKLGGCMECGGAVKAQMGLEVQEPINITLPEFTVISSRPDSENYETLRLLKNTEEAYDKQIYPVWSKSGKPKIIPLKEERRGRAYFQPGKNTMGVRFTDETIISQVPNKKDKSLLEDYLNDDKDRVNSDEKFKDIQAVYDRYATFPTPKYDDIAAELTHALQLKSRGPAIHKIKHWEDWLRSPYLDSDSKAQHKLYDMEGTLEHEAHSVMAPQMEPYYTGLKRYTIDVPNMTKEEYKKQDGGYVVKKGDSLSKIAKELGVPLQDIISANNIKDPNKIIVGQSLIMPTKTTKVTSEKKSNDSSYKVQKNDSLGSIAKKYNVSVQDIAKANNIKNVNKINIGQDLIIPKDSKAFSSKELVQVYKDQKKQEAPDKQITYDDKKLYKGFDESSVDNEQVVLSHLRGKEPFVLIDKKTNTLRRYDSKGNIIGEMRVGLGSDKGDKFTINSKNKAVDRNTTPGGIYIVDEKKPNESYRHLYENNILLLKSQAGLRQATSIHQVPAGNTKRDQWLADDDLTNDDFSNGCINCNKAQFEKYLKTVGTGEKVVILPEEEGNYFTVKDGQLNFTTNKNKEVGQYNFTPKSKEYKPLEYEFNTDTEIKSKYVQALRQEKKKLMKDLNLSSDEYDELAKRAYGILGQESSFGEGSLNPLNNYKLEELYTILFDTPEQRQNRSLGLTQVRLKNVNPEIAKKYGIDTKSLYYPYQSAVATMSILADGLQAVKNPVIRDKYENITPENVYDYTTTFYNKPNTVRRGEASGKNTYVQNVKKNYSNTSNSNPTKEKLAKLETGGKLQSFKNKWLHEKI